MGARIWVKVVPSFDGQFIFFSSGTSVIPVSSSPGSSSSSRYHEVNKKEISRLDWKAWKLFVEAIIEEPGSFCFPEQVSATSPA